MPAFIRGLVRLIHPFPVTIVVATTVLLVVLFHRGTTGFVFMLRAAGVILSSQITVGALNDYVDRDRDAAVQPRKPIPSGLVPARAALALSLLALILFIPLAATFGALAFGMIALGTAAGIAYDLWLKPTPLSFTAYLVGFLSLITWIWLIDSRFTAGYLLIYPLGALLLIAAHLAQSFPDIETDRAVDSRGLAAILGPVRTFGLIAAAYVTVAAAAIVLAVFAHTYAALAMALVAGVILVPVTRLGIAGTDNHDTRVRIFHLVAPGIGLLAIASLLALSSLN